MRKLKPLVTDPFRQTETNNWLLGGCSVRQEAIECLIGDIYYERLELITNGKRVCVIYSTKVIEFQYSKNSNIFGSNYKCLIKRERNIYKFIDSFFF